MTFKIGPQGYIYFIVQLLPVDKKEVDVNDNRRILKVKAGRTEGDKKGYTRMNGYKHNGSYLFSKLIYVPDCITAEKNVKAEFDNIRKSNNIPKDFNGIEYINWSVKECLQAYYKGLNNALDEYNKYNSNAEMFDGDKSKLISKNTKSKHFIFTELSKFIKYIDSTGFDIINRDILDIYDD